jgi:polyhydroxyalkanoate synthesis regulator phasin
VAESRGSSRGSSRSSGGRGSSGGSSRSGSRSSSRSSSSRSSSSRSSSSRSSASRSGGQTKRRAAAKKGGQARARQQKAQKAARRATKPAEGTEFAGKSVAELRDALAKGVVAPLNLVMISRDRIEDAFDEAVKRGRLTADDAQDMVQNLLQRGRKQTNDVLSDLEQLLGRGGEVVGTARKRGTAAAKKSRTRVRGVVDPALAQADRARRRAGVGPNFPIIGYDDLTAAQVQKRLDGLTPAELRKVRDYERRNANRKSVLDAIESKLSS